MIPLHKPSLAEAEVAAVVDVFKSGYLGMGRLTEDFEAAIRNIVGAAHVVAVNTGTSALHLALEALEIDPGAEILMPSFTYIACPQAAIAAGLQPVFCEVRDKDLTIDVEDLLSRITPRTRAIMPVHYGGVPCDMTSINSIARDRGLRVVDDAAHAFGSSFGGRMVGTLGEATCFSFDPIKTITCGEGGAVATGDAQIAERVRRMRQLGIERKGWQEGPATYTWGYTATGRGYRYHLPNLNAAIGLSQLTRMEQFVARRREIARLYDSAFGTMAGLEICRRNLQESVPFNYVIRAIDRRDDLLDALRRGEISAGVHYVPNHLQPAFRAIAKPLPVTERIFKEILTLPMYVDMTDAEVGQVIDTIGFAVGAIGFQQAVHG